jgi:SAM-dependent methyltransferase
MAACVQCNLCEHPGTLAGASEAGVEVGAVACNVREFSRDLFTLWRCTGCGSLHCAEDADLDRYYARYPLKSQKLSFNDRIGYRNRWRLIQAQGLDRSARILDYGCGAGLFVGFLREQGVENAVGYDPFVPAHSDPSVLHEQYDAVVSYDVIEHSDEPRAFLRSLVRLVKPGGLLVIGTPNAENVSVSRKGDPSLHVPYHRHILSERALLALGKEAGCEPAQVYQRSFYDSLYPTVNSRFMWRYIQKTGGLLDAAVEPPRTGLVLRSPDLLFFALFGYFFPLGDNIVVSFRVSAQPPDVGNEVKFSTEFDELIHSP